MPVIVSEKAMGRERGKGERTGNLLALNSVDVVHDDVTSGHIVAVTAATVELSEVLDVEARDLKGTATVLLEDLVLSLEGTTAGDLGGLAIGLLLDGEGVLADSAPPDVGERAGSEAMHTLDLVGTDDHVGQGSAVLDLEDGVAVVTLFLTGAGHAAVVHDHASVEALAGGNSLDGAEGRSAGGGGQLGGDATADGGAGGSRGGRGRGAGRGRGSRGHGRGGDNSGDFELHCELCRVFKRETNEWT